MRTFLRIVFLVNLLVGVGFALSGDQTTGIYMLVLAVISRIDLLSLQVEEDR